MSRGTVMMTYSLGGLFFPVLILETVFDSEGATEPFLPHPPPLAVSFPAPQTVLVCVFVITGVQGTCPQPSLSCPGISSTESER